MLRTFDAMEKKFFTTGIAISMIAHLLTIGILSIPFARGPKNIKRTKSLEVTYQDLKQVKKKKKETVFRDLGVRKPKDNGPQKVEVLTKEGNIFSTIGNSIRDISKISGQLLAGQHKTPKISTLDLDRKITLMPIGTTKINNPKYIAYNSNMYDAISRNIKLRAYTYVNHRDFEAGKVYLTFVLDSNGTLKQIQIIDRKTEANDYLRRVALNSVKESNFPPFPIGFDYPEFTFNLLITFQE